MSTTFKEWILAEDHDYDSEQDRLEHDAFEFVFDKIKKASEEASKSNLSLADAIKHAWPESEGGKGIKFALPRDRFPTLANLRVRINYTTDESSVERYSGEVGTLYVGAASLQNGLQNKDEAAVQDAMRRIAGSLNHETTHIHHKGADEGDGGVEDAVRYMVNPGEMRAHAKDYAYTWADMFPREAFDVQRFISEVIPKLAVSKQQKAKNYLVAFSDPQKQAKYKHVADIGVAHKQLVEMISGYINFYMKRNQARGSQTQQQSNQFQGFGMGDPRTSQQRQQYLASIGVDTTGWGRAEIMRGVKNK